MQGGQMSKKSDKIVDANLSHNPGGPEFSLNSSDPGSLSQSEAECNRYDLTCKLPLDSIREPMCVVNHEGPVIDCNAAACGSFGLKRNDLLTSVVPPWFQTPFLTNPQIDFQISSKIQKCFKNMLRSMALSIKARIFQ
jgi:hypothetical protein